MAVQKKLRFEIFKRDSFTCQYCGRKTPAVVLELDHIQPRSAGGTDDEQNLVTSCFDCNRGKGAGLLSSALPSQEERLARMVEAEEQLKAYRRQVAKIEKRKRYDLEKVQDAFQESFPKRELKREFLELSVKSFIERLPLDEVVWAMHRACQKCRDNADGAVRYFCGICWKKIRDNG